LVGDSVGMVYAGYENTIPVTIDEIIYHAKAVNRKTKNALLVVDMPFMSFQINSEETLRNAGRILKESGAESVKMEGGKEIIESVLRCVNAGIPVMGHLGLTPQSIHQFGNYRVQAKSKKAKEKLIRDALELQEAGCYAIVLEKIPALLAKEVTEKLKIPTIGIGAGKYTDGQILVTYDMLGMFEDFHPKFVRQYINLAKEIKTTISQYVKDVKTNSFPSDKESF
ncbi:MAG: 3-methyl-2-oxobutanoate hydroxymethyltransferase, partial [Candidatus Marinimicrobia bacterium]|nr:3-methyl-2-oxobutanoate hydroxymethyltransferase [Candidatus Neomarinimicrobiota bacterium]